MKRALALTLSLAILPSDGFCQRGRVSAGGTGAVETVAPQAMGVEVSPGSAPSPEVSPSLSLPGDLSLPNQGLSGLRDSPAAPIAPAALAAPAPAMEPQQPSLGPVAGPLPQGSQGLIMPGNPEFAAGLRQILQDHPGNAQAFEQFLSQVSQPGNALQIPETSRRHLVEIFNRLSVPRQEQVLERLNEIIENPGARQSFLENIEMGPQNIYTPGLPVPHFPRNPILFSPEFSHELAHTALAEADPVPSEEPSSVDYPRPTHSWRQIDDPKERENAIRTWTVILSGGAALAAMFLKAPLLGFGLAAFTILLAAYQVDLFKFRTRLHAAAAKYRNAYLLKRSMRKIRTASPQRPGSTAEALLREMEAVDVMLKRKELPQAEVQAVESQERAMRVFFSLIRPIISPQSSRSELNDVLHQLRRLRALSIGSALPRQVDNLIELVESQLRSKVLERISGEISDTSSEETLLGALVELRPLIESRTLSPEQTRKALLLRNLGESTLLRGTLARFHKGMAEGELATVSKELERLAPIVQDPDVRHAVLLWLDRLQKEKIEGLVRTVGSARDAGWWAHLAKELTALIDSRTLTANNLSLAEGWLGRAQLQPAFAAFGRLAEGGPDGEMLDALKTLEEIHEAPGTREFARTAVVREVVNLLAKPEISFPVQRGAVLMLSGILQRHQDHPEFEVSRSLAAQGLSPVFQRLIPHSGGLRLQLQSVLPRFLNFGALFDYFTAVRDAAAAEALGRLSPTARIALELKAYAHLLRGGAPAEARRELMDRAAEVRAREERLRRWKPTLGVELELFTRTVPRRAFESPGRPAQNWVSQAEFFSKAFGVHVTYDFLGEMMLEYSPGPAFDWRTLDEMVDALRDVELVPPAQGDYSKLHVTVVHADPLRAGADTGAWRWEARTIALLQGLLAVDSKRLEEARKHLRSFRKEDWRNNSDHIDISGLPRQMTRRGEYLAGSVTTDPLPSDPSGASASVHRKALRMVDTLHTAMFVRLMEGVEGRDTHLPPDYVIPFVAEHPQARARLARLFDAYQEEVHAFLRAHSFLDQGRARRSLFELVGMMNPDSVRDDDFTLVRRDQALIAELDALVERHVAAMDAVIAEMAAGTDSH